MIKEQEKLEFESLPEYVRDSYASAKDTYALPKAPRGSNHAAKEVFSTPVNLPDIDDKFRPIAGEHMAEDGKLSPHIEEIVRPKDEALDTLWPGVDDKFFHPSTKAPSFYLTIGFMAGAVASLILVSAYVFLTRDFNTPSVPNNGKKIVMNGKTVAGTKADSGTALNPAIGDGTEVIVPLFPTYEVKSGDTLAGIALKAYKRVSPRMLDAICKANGLRSANVLNLGQKITLPEYRPQTGNVTTTVNP